MADLMLVIPHRTFPPYNVPSLTFFNRLNANVSRVEAKGNGKGRSRTYLADVQVVFTPIDLETDILDIENVKKNALKSAVGDNLTVDEVEWQTEHRCDDSVHDYELDCVALVGFAQIELTQDQANEFLIAYHKTPPDRGIVSLSEACQEPRTGQLVWGSWHEHI